jgi:uncharacterized protein DUF1353
MTPTVLEVDPEPRMWIVWEPLVWQDQRFGRIVVPKGFRTDLASVPRVFRQIPSLDPDGISRPSALGHDWLYAWRGFSKDDADEFLKQSLVSLGASALVADVYYLAVHNYGQSSWDSDNDPIGPQDFDTPEHFQAWLATKSAA